MQATERAIPVLPGRRGRSLGLARVAVACLLYTSFSLAATVVHRPYLQNMQQNEVTIVWSTRENLPSTVQYSPDASFVRSANPSVRLYPRVTTNSQQDFYQYRAVLTGLDPDTAYNYRVIAGGQDITTDGERQFRTTPPAGSFRFLAFGDSGQGSPQQLTLARLMFTEQANLLLHVGDIAYEDGTFDQFQANYFEYYWPMMRRLPMFPVPGNHEYNTASAAPYLALHAPPFTPTVPQDQGRYYSYDWGDVHFVALDANLLVQPYSAAAELAWMEQDLAATTAKWKIVYWHQVPYPVLHHIDDPVCIAAREQFVPILERHGVQLVLTGHEHNYLRDKPLRANQPVTSGPSTQYVSSGGGGGGLHPVVPRPWIEYEASVYHYLTVDVESSRITVRAIGLDGKEFDRVVLAQPSVADAGVVNGASFTPSLAPGELISIFGEGLANQTWIAQAYPLPTLVGGSTLMLNGTPLPLMYVSPGQINAQIPMDVRGPATLVASTFSGKTQVGVTVLETAPAVFPSGVLHSDGRPVSSAAPAAGGETLVIYMTGLGQVNGSLATGQPAPSSPLLSVTNPVQVQFGNAMLTPDFAGLTPGYVGVYQVNVRVPGNLPTDSYPVRVMARGNVSTPTSVQVKNP